MLPFAQQFLLVFLLRKDLISSNTSLASLFQTSSDPISRTHSSASTGQVMASPVFSVFRFSRSLSQSPFEPLNPSRTTHMAYRLFLALASAPLPSNYLPTYFDFVQVVSTALPKQQIDGRWSSAAVATCALFSKGRSNSEAVSKPCSNPNRP
ncbi:hypothetical protein L596_024002 [Steinernema carpocapsae]|uniref:Uncharacterized protein n=1 Tax=Steinernema carpocapsae TaxID=34508 RepID=A0A4U5MFD5_STECR|nr:hypothetical protein L596_024002 [Steinernema carpocapsae]